MILLMIMISADMASPQLLLGQIQTVTVDSPYVKALLEEVKVALTEAVAGSSAKGYSGHWRRWVAFAEEHHLVPLSADPDVLCGYFLHL